MTIGKIERHFGVRGEFKVRSLSDVPGRLDQLKQVQVLEPTGQTVERTVTHVRRAGSTYIMGLAGVTTPEEAGTAARGIDPSATCVQRRRCLRMSILNVISSG